MTGSGNEHLALRESFDVVVVASGAAGATAALRSADQGLKVLRALE